MMHRVNPRLAAAFGKALKTVCYLALICLVILGWVLALVAAWTASILIGSIVTLVCVIFVVTIFHYYDPVSKI